MAAAFEMATVEAYNVERIDLPFLLQKLIKEGVGSTTKLLGQRSQALDEDRRKEVIQHILGTGFTHIHLTYCVAVPLEEENSPEANAWVEANTRRLYKELLRLLLSHSQLGSYSMGLLQSKFMGIYGILEQHELLDEYVELKFSEVKITDTMEAVKLDPRKVMGDWSFKVREYLEPYVKNPSRFQGDSFYGPFYKYVLSLINGLSRQEAEIVRDTFLKEYRSTQLVQLNEPDEITLEMLIAPYASDLFFQIRDRLESREG